MNRPGLAFAAKRSAAFALVFLMAACSAAVPTRTPQPEASVPPSTSPPALPSATRLALAEPLIRWEHTTPEGECLAARLDRSRIQVGRCGSEGSIVPLDPHRRVEIGRFLADYWSFQADTQAGMIEFDSRSHGGNKVPSRAEERMIASWIWLLAEEVLTGEPPQWSLALEWKRDTGQDCRVLQVDVAAKSSAFSCVGTNWTLLGEARLEADDLEMFYLWLDRFEPGEFNGIMLRSAGSIPLGPDDLQEMHLFAEGQHAMLASFSPQARGVPVARFAQAAFLTFDSWSPDGKSIAYWASSADTVEAYRGYGMPGGVLHFGSLESGEACPVPEVESEHAYEARVRWIEGNAAQIRLDGFMHTGLPCQPGPFERTPAQGRPESSEPVGLSPDGSFQAVTEELASADHGWDLRTSLIESRSRRIANQLEWRHRGGHGALGLGGEWVSPTQFLIYEAVDEGPLLLHIDGTVTRVLTEIIGLPRVPNLESDGFSLGASPNPGEREDGFELVIAGLGEEARFPAVRLYHAATGIVEELPFTHLWGGGFVPSQDWILLYEGKVSGGFQTGYNLWARRVAAVGGEWSLIAPVVDYLVWNEGADEMAFTQNEMTLVWESIPSGLELGRWNAAPFSLVPVGFSPDSSYVAGIGNLPGQSEYGLFVLER